MQIDDADTSLLRNSSFHNTARSQLHLCRWLAQAALVLTGGGALTWHTQSALPASCQPSASEAAPWLQQSQLDAVKAWLHGTGAQVDCINVKASEKVKLYHIDLCHQVNPSIDVLRV